MSSRRSALVWGIAMASVVAACSKQADQASREPRTLTQAQRDSAIAASPLPGAGTLGKALEVADSADARADESEP
ncbi:MAG: hypothetical protein L0Z51_05445 [Candidatus Latescibacteria bacterium]|nr:hypothetical protein [Candidatus Latescibacterota bacterium]